MENGITLTKSDEEILEGYDKYIEQLHFDLAEYEMDNPYFLRIRNWNMEAKKKELEAVKRKRQAQIDKMSLRQPKEIWFKSQWFTNILSAIIGAVATLLTGWLWK